MSFLKRQAVYALLGVVADDCARPLRLPPAPLSRRRRSSSSRSASARPCSPSRRRSTARGAGSSSGRRASSRPSSRSSRSASSPRSTSRGARRPGRSASSSRPLGLVTAIFCAPDPARARPRNDDLALRDGARGAASSPACRCACSRSRRSWPSRSGCIAIWVEPYRRARVFSFLDPWSDAQGSGFQIVQAMIGIGSGGITGEPASARASQKMLYLPGGAHGHDLRRRSARSSGSSARRSSSAPSRPSRSSASASRCAAATPSGSCSPPG